jgi:predicted nucleic acid-binding protein
MTFVVDSAVSLAWCFEDEQTEAVMTLLDRVAEEGAIAPQLWPLEALNGLLMAERRGRLDTARRQRFTGLLQSLPIMIDVETAAQAWSAVARLAEQFWLTPTMWSIWNSRSGGPSPSRPSTSSCAPLEKRSA